MMNTQRRYAIERQAQQQAAQRVTDQANGLIGSMEQPSSRVRRRVIRESGSKVGQ